MFSLPQLLRKAQAVRAFLRLVRDMGRTDEVFEVVSGIEASEMMERMKARLASDPEGEALLKARNRVGALDLKTLGQLPEGTLGRAYADHMTALGLDPYFFPDVKVKSDIDYVRVALYETHDIWHVVTGFATDVPGELGLQAFYAAQLRVGFLAPVLLAAGFLNAALFNVADVGPRLEAVSRGWRMGQGAKLFFGRPWADMWSKSLVEIRRELGIDQPEVNILPAVKLGAAAVG